MGTNTANYNLYKPDDPDLVTVSSDISANMDLIDAALDDHDTDVTNLLAADAALDVRIDALEVLPPFAVVGKSATTTQSIPDTNDTLVQFQSNVVSRPAGFATQGSEGLTIPQDGWYMIDYQVVWENNATGRREVTILNGATVIHTNRSGVSGNVGWYMQRSFVAEFNAGDVITMHVLQTSGGALNVSAGGPGTNTNTYISGRFLFDSF